MTKKFCPQAKHEDESMKFAACVVDNQSYAVGSPVPSLEFCKTCTCGDDLNLACDKVASCDIPVVPFQNIALGSDPLLIEDADFLIRDAKSWEALRTQVGEQLASPVNNIDFSREFVVATVRTLVNTNSDTVLIKSLAVIDGQLVINLVTQGPPCATVPSKRRVYHLVRAPIPESLAAKFTQADAPIDTKFSMHYLALPGECSIETGTGFR